MIVLAAAFDRVFVETVGVGQSEVEVASLVDTLVYAVGPDSGDAVQFMKAGILEHPDVFSLEVARAYERMHSWVESPSASSVLAL